MNHWSPVYFIKFSSQGLLISPILHYQWQHDKKQQFLVSKPQRNATDLILPEKLEDEKILFMYLDIEISQTLEISQRSKLMKFKSWKTHVNQNLEPQKLCKRKSSTFLFKIVLNFKI